MHQWQYPHMPFLDIMHSTMLHHILCQSSDQNQSVIETPKISHQNPLYTLEEDTHAPPTKPWEII